MTRTNDPPETRGRARAASTLAVPFRSLRRVLVAIAACLAVTLAARTASADALAPLVLGNGERLLVVAPHPDDETIATAGLIQQVLAGGGSVRVVLVTAGDGYQDAVRRITPETPPQPHEYVAYGERRIGEAEASAETLGGGRIDVELLGFPDGGLKGLLDDHWPRSKPERSQTTGAADPPYDEARDPRLPYSGANLRAELTRILRETRPTVVALPDPVDIHPDHSAAGIFTLLALEDWQRSSGRARTTTPASPRLLAYLVHWPNWPSGWMEWNPSPGELASTSIEPPPKIPAREVTVRSLALDDSQRGQKRAALDRYSSQLAISPAFLNAFVRTNELFFELTPQVVGSVVAHFPWAVPNRSVEPTRHARAGSTKREDVRAR